MLLFLWLLDDVLGGGLMWMELRRVRNPVLLSANCPAFALSFFAFVAAFGC